MAHALAPTREPRTPLTEPGTLVHFASDMYATFAADVTLEAANAELARGGQWLPIDGDPALTLGELLLTDSTGPLRLGYGAWRDLLLGLQFSNGRGELISAGGMTVKNVAGYDLTKFLVGSAGCFGTPVTLTTRTHRLPDGALIADLEKGDDAFVHGIIQTDLRPQWIIAHTNGLTLGYIGKRRQLAFWEAELRDGMDGPAIDRIRGIGLDRADELRRQLWPAPPVGNLRVALPPASAVAALRSSDAPTWAVDPVHGIAVANADDPNALADKLASHGGNAVVYTDGKPTRWDVAENVRPLLARLKHRFDPDDTLPPLPIS
ncbi:MAG: FAD-binding protein [Planctomycetota bacterium]